MRRRAADVLWQAPRALFQHRYVRRNRSSQTVFHVTSWNCSSTAFSTRRGFHLPAKQPQRVLRKAHLLYSFICSATPYQPITVHLCTNFTHRHRCLVCPSSTLYSCLRMGPEDAAPPPPHFLAIQDVLDSPRAIGRLINVIGVVMDFRAPIPSRHGAGERKRSAVLSWF